MSEKKSPKSPLIKTATPAVAIAAVGYFLFAGLSGLWPFWPGDGDGYGDGDGDGTGTAIVSVVDSDDTEHAAEPEPAGDPPSLVIEIHEDKIIYDGEEISLYELEDILKRHESGEHGWTLRDAYRADKDTFDRVRELLADNGIFFAEG